MPGFSFTVDTSDQRLDHFLTERAKASRAFVQEQIRAGRITRNGEAVTKPGQKLKAGDIIAGRFEEKPVDDAGAVDGKLDILFEDDSFLVVDKPQGLVVHPAAGHRGDTLVHYLLHHLKSHAAFSALGTARPGIVHRLDRGTSGVILVAKTREVQESLSAMFKAREIKKEYEAVVWGKTPARGMMRSKIGRDKRDRKKMSSRTDTGRESLTEWARLREFSHFSHLQLLPHTGRTHQLRVHCAESRYPIVGDTMYGGASPARAKPLAEPLREILGETQHPFLHAKRLRFAHPATGAACEFEAPRPPHFTRLLELLERWDP